MRLAGLRVVDGPRELLVDQFLQGLGGELCLLESLLRNVCVQCLEQIWPLASSSMRLMSWRAVRKLDGTTPLAVPECTPSVSTSTRSVPVRLPRKDVVHQSWS